MRKLTVTLIAIAAILSTGALSWKAEALGIARLGAPENTAMQSRLLAGGEELLSVSFSLLPVRTLLVIGER